MFGMYVCNNAATTITHHLLIIIILLIIIVVIIVIIITLNSPLQFQPSAPWTVTAGAPPPLIVHQAASHKERQVDRPRGGGWGAHTDTDHQD